MNTALALLAGGSLLGAGWIVGFACGLWTNVSRQVGDRLRQHYGIGRTDRPDQ